MARLRARPVERDGLQSIIQHARELDGVIRLAGARLAGTAGLATGLVGRHLGEQARVGRQAAQHMHEIVILPQRRERRRAALGFKRAAHRGGAAEEAVAHRFHFSGAGGRIVRLSEEAVDARGGLRGDKREQRGQQKQMAHGWSSWRKGGQALASSLRPRATKSVMSGGTRMMESTTLVIIWPTIRSRIGRSP